MIRVGLVGVTGYTGMELARILAWHPSMLLAAATSRQEAGRRLDNLYPFMAGLTGADLLISEAGPERLAGLCDIVFLAIPHGAAMETGAALIDAGVKVVDLSADFRLTDPAIYAKWYQIPHSRPEHLKQAVYGLPELKSDRIRTARLVANPGCYPTSVILGLYAALKNNLIERDDIIIDSKSGTTGAGRKPGLGNLFDEVYDTFRPYSLGKHRHTPEIEQELSIIADKSMVVSFNPHLLPINRGILSTIYTKLRHRTSQDEIQHLFETTWAEHAWIRVLPAGQLPETKNVRGTMFCDIGLTLDTRTERLIITSAIDNLCRGASGQAVANANLMSDLPVSAGLQFAPLMP